MKVSLDISYEVTKSSEEESDEALAAVEKDVSSLVDTFTRMVQDNAGREGGIRSIRIERE